MSTVHCPFCKIISDQSERIINETKHSFIVLSNPRLMPGHLLVIPKQHVEKLSELEPEERGDLLETVIHYQDRILQKIAPGCDISQHFRPFISEGRLKINHLHIHLRPRFNEDELYQKVQKNEVGVFQNLSEKEFLRYKDLLT